MKQKPCRHCKTTFSPKERHSLYCDECLKRLDCTMCGSRLNVHFNRVAARRRKCVACHLLTASETAPKGERAGNWNGGRHKTVNGYIVVRQPDHPNSMKSGYVLEHVLLISEAIGRPLEKGEVSHHVNGIKDDNRLENLRLMSKTAHDRLHKPEREAAQWGHVRKKNHATCPFWSGK